MDKENKNIIEILELAKEDIKNNNKGVSAVLDLEDLKSLQELVNLYTEEKKKNQKIKIKLEEKNIPIETLLAEFERLENLEDKLEETRVNNKKENLHIKLICLMEGDYENVEYHGSREDFLYNIAKEELIQVFYEGKEVWLNTDYIMSFEI